MMRNHHRRLLVLSGNLLWCRETAVELMDTYSHVLWLGDPSSNPFTSTSLQHACRWLGRETEALVYDAHEGFDPDIFCALSATVIGSGTVCLLIPPLSEWAERDDPAASRWLPYPYRSDQIHSPFLERLVRFIRENESLTLIPQGDPLPSLAPALKLNMTERISSAEQKDAVAAVIKAACGHSRRPLILISDRGRGKSTAFGMAAAQLLLLGKQRILVTAHQPEAISILFRQVMQDLPRWSHKEGLIYHGAQELRYFPPDHLVRHLEPADLLLVDEAAAIPVPLLETLLQRYNRIAFATTEHGYEGSGRGFTLKFTQVLDRLAPRWRRLRLEQPLRWALGDPVERFVSQAFLLDRVPALPSLEPDQGQLVSIEQHSLSRDEELVSQLFSLLRFAHYQTRPSDLRLLLDRPDLYIWAIRIKDQVVAAIVLSMEGGLDISLAQEIYLGRRRPHGHMLPQTLSAHAGFHAAPGFRYLRVMRIAVHPALQGRDLGTRLLEAAERTARSQDCDFVGAIFGVSPILLSFWRKSGYWPVRIGPHRGTASGGHSVTLLKPLSQNADPLFDAMRKRFCSALPLCLSDPLDSLDWESAATLLFNCTPPELNEQDKSELYAFAHQQRDFDSSRFALHRFSIMACCQSAVGPELALLVPRVLQNRSWQECATHAGLVGQQAFLQQLRRHTATLLTRLCVLNSG